MTSWAKPGVKCVCVDATRGRVSGLPVPFAFGDVLTIRQVAYDGGLRFVGIPTIDPQDGRRTTYAIERFRPLVTRTQSQDLALFTPLLETQGVDA